MKKSNNFQKFELRSNLTFQKQPKATKARQLNVSQNTLGLETLATRKFHELKKSQNFCI